MRNIHKGGLSSSTMRSPADLLLLIRCKTIRPDQQIEGPYQAMQHPKRHRWLYPCPSQPQVAHPHHHQTICRYHHSLFRFNKYKYVILCQKPYHLNIRTKLYRRSVTDPCSRRRRILDFRLADGHLFVPSVFGQYDPNGSGCVPFQQGPGNERWSLGEETLCRAWHFSDSRLSAVVCYFSSHSVSLII